MLSCTSIVSCNNGPAREESLETLTQEYVATAPSLCTKVRRLILGRLLAGALNRQGASIVVPVDRLLRRQDRNNRRHPYIYTTEEVERLLETAPDILLHALRCVR